MIFDLEMLRAKYRALEAGLGDATIHYAVKANPAPEIVAALAELGGRFDCASRGEIDLCLGLGVAPDRIAFGNTIKRAADIAHAHAAGVEQFAADAEEELTKIAAHAPGARVIIRMLVEASEADWPLSRKFGCSRREALRLMDLGRWLGLDVAGISFHPGSQVREPADVGERARRRARALDRGGRGGPRACASSTSAAASRPSTAMPLPATEDYAAEVMRMVRHRFGEDVAGDGRARPRPRRRGGGDRRRGAARRAEGPGRPGALGLPRHRQVLRARRDHGRGDPLPVRDPPRRQAETGPCILAGPSCDSADVLYEKRPVQLPLALAAGDKVRILCTGAYTTSYSSVGFNGFPPLDAVYVG